MDPDAPHAAAHEAHRYAAWRERFPGDPMDPLVAKANQHKMWTEAAPGWRKKDEWIQGHTAPVSARMCARLKPGDRVLDIASGTGEPALTAAPRVLPGGDVIGVDFVEEMLAIAREKAAQRGIRNVEFRRMDGETLDFPPDSFDAATFRWGLMFMPDPHACLSRIQRALKPGASLTLTCWAAPEKNPWVTLPLAVIKTRVEVPDPPPGTPGPFTFADPDKLRAVLATAGFSRVTLETMDLTMADFDTGAEYVSSMLDLAATLRDLMSKQPPDLRKLLTAEIAREAERIGGGRAHLRGQTWVATAWK